MTSARHSIVVDPAEVGQGGVEKAWAKYYEGKILSYRYECLRSGIKDEIDKAVKQGISRERILVVACHACQHLSEETCEIATKMGVNIAVMPCCQVDIGIGAGSWKSLSKNLKIPFAPIMDILLAGKIKSWGTGKEAGVSYNVRIKLIDKNITPQNRLIVGKIISQECKVDNNDNRDVAHRRLQSIYEKAHKNSRTIPESKTDKNCNDRTNGLTVTNSIVLTNLVKSKHFLTSLTIGFILGCTCSTLVMKHR